MTPFQRIAREPALISGVVQATLALVVAFGLDLTADQVATILAVTAALLALVTRALVTPAAEVVAQRLPGKTVAEAAAGSPLPDGTPVALTAL